MNSCCRWFLLSVVALLLAACASGTALVTGTPRNPLAPEQVNIYLEPPAEYEIVGLVSASSDAGWTDQGSLDYAIHELKKQAAKMGANGVLLTSSGEKVTTILVGQNASYAIPVTAKTVQGRAIFVKAK